MGRERAMTSILIADDHPIFRAGLRVTIDAALGDEVQYSEVGTAASLFGELEKYVPDLLVLDVFFPGLEPEAHIKDLRQKCPLMAILVISMLTERSAVDRLIRAGANGFVSKSTAPDEIEQAFVDVLNGDRPICLPARGRGRPSGGTDDPVDGLPLRQRQVLELICMGLSNKEIARDLDLSVSTVRAHVSALLQKLGVSNRAAAASYCAARIANSTPDQTENS